VKSLLHRIPLLGRWGELGLVGKVSVVLGTVALAGVAAGAAFTVYVYAMWVAAPDLADLKQRDKGENSTLLADDGSRLGVVQSETLRTELEEEEVPQLVRDATVAAEDRRFREHEGIDFKGVLRAAFENVRAGEIVEGASTLTQQTARNLYLTKEQTLGRKIKEAKLASEMENRLDKDQILTLYLNNVPYGTVNGQSSIGIHAAARTFFGKPVKELMLHEAALLAGLPRAPALYEPFSDEEAARERRRQVLEAMAETGKVSRARARAAAARPLGVERGGFYTRQEERYFFEYVKQSLIDRYGRERVERGGLEVRTTVDVDRQEQAREAIASQLGRDDDPAAALVSIEPQSGQIKTMVTSERYGRTKFNLAVQARRQPGSAFKPVVLMTALSRGVDPDRTTYESKRLDLDDPRYGEIEVRNFGGRYRGDIDLIRATVKSDNAVYQQLALDLGLDAVKENARRIGMSAALEGRPAEALGGLERGVAPLDVSRAYATLAGGGVRTRPQAVRSVSFPDGEKETFDEPEGERAYERPVTRKATEILARNVRRGTGTSAQIGCPAAGKTGTTDDFKDAWFAGYTPGLSTAVWVGYAEPKPMRDVHGVAVAGGTFPARIWARYMREAVGEGCERFEPPDEDELSLEPYCARYATTPSCRADDPEAGSGGEDEGGGEQRRRERREERDGGGKDRSGGEAERDGAGAPGGGSDRDGKSGGDETTGGGQDGRGGGGKDDGGERDGGQSRAGKRPDTRIESSPSQRTSKRTARFRFSASSGSGSAVRFECRLDEGSYRSCQSPRRYTGLARGSHVFRVRAIGSGGRRDRSPATYRWTIRSGGGG
jgi:penicillin-binding protein 1A